MVENKFSLDFKPSAQVRRIAVFVLLKYAVIGFVFYRVHSSPAKPWRAALLISSLYTFMYTLFPPT